MHFFVLPRFSLGDFTNRIENLFTAMWQQFTLMRHKPCVSQPPLELAFSIPISMSRFSLSAFRFPPMKERLASVANKDGLARCAPFNLAQTQGGTDGGAGTEKSA